jgi:hypothetical protein
MSKGLIRSGSRRGVRSDKSPAVARETPRVPEPAVCRRCGSVFARRTWRADRPLTHDLLARATWTICPACKGTGRAEGYGRVVIRGAYAAAHKDAIRRRIRNVASRARFTQPQRRLVSTEWTGSVLEVLTTSQKLAHRIVHELRKAFRGRARYAWADADGTLLAMWERDS